MFAWESWASWKSEQIIHKTGNEMGAQCDDKSQYGDVSKKEEIFLFNFSLGKCYYIVS